MMIWWQIGGWICMVSGAIYIAARLAFVRLKGKQPGILGVLGLTIFGFVVLSVTETIKPDDAPELLIGAAITLGIMVFVSIGQRLADRKAEPPAVEAPPRATPSTYRLNVPIIIRYRDSMGDRSERTVTVHKLVETPPAKIDGYCHLTKQPRTFRLSRIKRAADATTGEIIPDLSAWLRIHALSD